MTLTTPERISDVDTPSLPHNPSRLYLLFETVLPSLDRVAAPARPVRNLWLSQGALGLIVNT